MRVQLLFAVAGLIASTAVSRAETLNFTITSGSDTATFSLASNPTPTSYLEGDATYFTVPVNLDGTTTTDSVVFGNASTGISFADLDNSLFFLGTQLYTGTEASPVFSPELVNVATAAGGAATIDITAATSVTPEPSSFLLLGTGLLGAFGITRKSRGQLLS